MKVLAIIANPRKTSYTRKLLDAFLTSYRHNHPSDEITELELYQTDIPLIDDAVLQAWGTPPQKLSLEEQRKLAEIDLFTDQFIAADKIVFAAPMWNLQFPPQLLAYLATIMVAGKTFAYTEHGCQGLLKNKPILLLHIRGGIFSDGPMKSLDYAAPYLKAICAMIGITDFKAIICEGLEMYPDKANYLLDQAMLQAIDAAMHF